MTVESVTHMKDGTLLKMNIPAIHKDWSSCVLYVPTSDIKPGHRFIVTLEDESDVTA